MMGKRVLTMDSGAIRQMNFKVVFVGKSSIFFFMYVFITLAT